MLSFAKTAGRVIAILVAIFCARALHAQTQPIQYYYDDLGRLVTMVDQSGNVVTYSYDAVGNILSISRSTVSAVSLALFDFNPQRGPVGTVITIRGQGFSATKSANTVKFNGTAATVTFPRSSSTLVATVPSGATTGPISVTVGGNTATSSRNFVIVPLTVITSVWPKSALFGVVVSNAKVIGENLLDARFSFSPAGPTVDLESVSVDPAGTSATLTFSAGNRAGTYALVATDPYGVNSGTVATAANRFTVVDPSSTAISACGIPDVIEAAYGLDPLDPKSCPTSNSIPLLGGNADATPFSVLNTAPPPGSPSATTEVDGVPFFSVLNTAPPPGSPSATTEADGVPFFSVLNTAPPPGSPSATTEADGVPFFSVLNTAPPPGSPSATMEADGIVFCVNNDKPTACASTPATPGRDAIEAGRPADAGPNPGAVKQHGERQQ